MHIHEKISHQGRHVAERAVRKTDTGLLEARYKFLQLSNYPQMCHL